MSEGEDELDESYLSEYADRVLGVVESIPAGRVLSYGDVAERVGEGGPRQVGQVLARYGGAVSWWRVIRANGSPPPGHERAAGRAWRAEGTPLRPDGSAVDMRRARWQP